MQVFKNYLERFAKLNQEEWKLIESKVKTATLEKGEYFLRQGEVNKKLGFIRSGVCRYTFLNEQDEEITKYFIREQQWLSGGESFTQQIPSENSIQALTDTEIYVIHYDSYRQLFSEIRDWAVLIQRITEFSFAEKVKNISPMLSQDARTRYENFLRTQPDVVQRVSLGHVASYLGITQQSLSRLRRDLAQQA